MTGMPQRDRLSEVLDYTFSRPDLLDQALTHSSMAQDRAGRVHTNERLEFLGDRALGLVVAEWLYNAFPAEEEGALARRFASLVRRESLAEVASALDLGSHLVLTAADENAAARANPGVLADACEALIGALFLDGGLDAVRPFVERHWTRLLEADIEPPRDAKTSLQEWAQGRGLPLPVYREIDRKGPPHEPVFTMEVRVSGHEPVRAQGSSKRLAEQTAAQELLDMIADDD
ncbi:MAG: ribonuclease III [Rhodospirillales bacterium]